MIPAFTAIIPGVSFMSLAAHRTGLAGIGWIYILHSDAKQFCFVLNVMCKTVEGPGVQTMVVFTTCSCRAADIGQLFQFDSADIILYSEVYDLPGQLMVDITHDALFLIMEFADRLELFRFTQLFALGLKPSPDEFVFPTVAHKLNFAGIGVTNGRTKNAQVHAHNVASSQSFLFGFYSNLGNELPAFLGDTHGPQFMSLQIRQSVFRDNCLYRNASRVCFKGYRERERK